MGTIFLIGNFLRYFSPVRILNSEVNKIVESLLTLDELSSNLTVVKESVKNLNKKINSKPSTLGSKNFFKNGDLVFRNVVFPIQKFQ
jgi:hypothetical protein